MQQILIGSLIWSAPAALITMLTPKVKVKEQMGILVAKAGPDDLAVFVPGETEGKWKRYTAETWAMVYKTEFPVLVEWTRESPGWGMVDGLEFVNGEPMRPTMFSAVRLDRALGRFADRDLWTWKKVIEKEESNQSVRVLGVSAMPRGRGCVPSRYGRHARA